MVWHGLPSQLIRSYSIVSHISEYFEKFCVCSIHNDKCSMAWVVHEAKKLFIKKMYLDLWRWIEPASISDSKRLVSHELNLELKKNTQLWHCIQTNSVSPHSIWTKLAPQKLLQISLWVVYKNIYIFKYLIAKKIIYFKHWS